MAKDLGLYLSPGIIIALPGALLVAYYRPPAETVAAAATRPSPLRGAALACVLLAGSIWGLYNAALGMIDGNAEIRGDLGEMRRLAALYEPRDDVVIGLVEGRRRHPYS